jgi:DNA-directed RNA polymerase subunit beta'
MASLGLHLATRAAPGLRRRAIRDLDGLVEMLERGALTIDDTVRIAGWTTTAGRHLVAACLPPSFRAVAEAPWDAVRGATQIARIVRELHVEIAGRCVEALGVLGTHVAARSGLSLAIDDFLPAAELREVVEAAARESAQITARCHDGLITDVERFNQQVDIWQHASLIALMYARRGAPEPDPIAACVAAQAEPVPPEELRSMRGVIEVPFGDGMVMHMTGVLGHGIAAHEYFVRAVEGRHRARLSAEQQQLAGQLLAELDAAIGDAEIAAVDCGTTRGIRIRATAFEDHATGSLAARVTGCVAAEAVRDRTGTVLAPAGAALTPALAQRIETAQIASVLVRDVRTCEAVGGVCSRCFGLSPEDALWTCVGDDVGARAAAAIATAAGAAADRWNSPNKAAAHGIVNGSVSWGEAALYTLGGGIVRYVDVRLLPCPDEPARVGQVVGPARIDILGHGRTTESFALQFGDELLVPDGTQVAAGTDLVVRGHGTRSLRAAIPTGVEAVVRWSTRIMRTRDDGAVWTRLRFARGVQPVTLELLVDEVSTLTVEIDRDAVPIVETGAVVRRGDRLAWRFDEPRTRWAWGRAGIETLRAILDVRRLDRQPTALVAPCDATVIDIGQRWIVLRTTSERTLRLRRQPQTHVLVHVGDAVEAGEPLTPGERNHRALLHAWGEDRLAEHLRSELVHILGDSIPRAYLGLVLRAMLRGGQLRGIAGRDYL